MRTDIMTTDPDYFYYRGGQLINILQGQGQSQPGQRFFQTATGLSAQINVGGNAGTWLIGADALGSILGGGDGTNSEEHRYAPYGGEKQQGATEGVMKLGYTGAYRDPLTGLYPLGNGYRCYLPELMCFNKADSLSPFGAGGINTRSYCEGDPINHSDPSGHVGGRGLKRGFGEAFEDAVEDVGLDVALGPDAIAAQIALEAIAILARSTGAAAEVADTAADAAGAVAGSSSNVSSQADLDDALEVIANETRSPLQAAAPTTGSNIAGPSTEEQSRWAARDAVDLRLDDPYFTDPGTLDKHLQGFLNPDPRKLSNKGGTNSVKHHFEYALKLVFLDKPEYVEMHNLPRFIELQELGTDEVRALVKGIEAEKGGASRMQNSHLGHVKNRAIMAMRLWDYSLKHIGESPSLDQARGEVFTTSDEWRSLWARGGRFRWWV